MSYASAADIISRKSVATLGDLVSDDGTRVNEAGLTTDDNLQAALDDASGDIDAALLQAGRYSPADLSGLSGNSLAHLKRITCEIAMAYLFARKPTYEVDRYKESIELSDMFLEKLRKGQNVFNITAVIDAGTPKYDAPTVASVTAKGFIRDRTHNYYPGRRSQSG